MDHLDRIYERNPDIVFRKVAGEYILVPIKRNVGDLESIYTLDEVAANIWEFFDGRRRVADIKEAITATFEIGPEAAEKDLMKFIQELESLGCIREKSPRCL